MTDIFYPTKDEILDILDMIDKGLGFIVRSMCPKCRISLIVVSNGNSMKLECPVCMSYYHKFWRIR